MTTWIIVPTYNERANIAELVTRTFAATPSCHLLVVDDGSPDGTAAEVAALQGQYPHLHLLERQGKQGLGSAYRVGFRYALEQGAEVVGEMDADLSHNPKDLPRLLGAVEQGAQVAIGSRRVLGGRIVGWNARRHLMSWGAMALARLVLGLRTHDVTSGFRLYTKTALAAIPWADVRSDGYAWQEELVFLVERAGLRVVEVPVEFVDRTQGASKLSLSNIVEFFATVARLRLRR
jgi:dolichol-phosphate mannosyltransferase